MEVGYKDKTIVIPVADVTVPLGEEQFGWRITLYGNTTYSDIHLANEAGDVMYMMEYNKESNEEGGNVTKSDTYWKKGFSGDYSRSVEYKYKERWAVKMANPNAVQGTPYPLKKETK